MTRAAALSHGDLVRAMVEGEHLDARQLNPSIHRSWKRCLQEYHLDPVAQQEPRYVERAQLAERREALAGLLAVAKVEMANLYQQVANSGYAIILTDRDGVILNFLGDPIFADTAARSGLQAGGVWSEETQGTNGMGTCLVERQALVVHQDDHFLSRNTHLTCSAAPIFDPQHALIGVLDASSVSRLAQQHTMALVSMSAQTIENRLFVSTHRSHHLVRFHSRPEFVGTLGEGLLAYDERGRLLAASRSALFQLGVGSPEEIVGRSVSEIFNIPFGALMDLAAKRSFYPVALRHRGDGTRFFTLIQPPEQGHDGAAVRLAAAARGARAQPTPPGAAEGTERRLSYGDVRMASNIARARKILGLEIPILIYGETGTGKEMFARFLHEASRPGRPFVPVNCAAIPETLIESELFGYRPGAFTGASRHGCPGKIVQANDGTLFLDEIGDMPLALQARLLRVLEQREVIPLGGVEATMVDIQIVSATHRDLRKLIREGRFREDLYYRLHGVSLTMPPLRERTDKRELIEAILRELRPPGEAVGIAPRAAQLLLSYRWPGNIRQLCNALQTSLALREGRLIRVRDLPEEIVQGDLDEEDPPPSPAVAGQGEESHPLAAAERQALLHELSRMHWNVSKVAQRLNLSRNTIYRKMRIYGIKSPR